MPAHRGAPGRSVGARDSPVDDAMRPAPGRVEYSTASGQRPDADAAVGEGIGVVPILEARPEVVVPADLGSVAVFVEDPVPPARLEGHVVHHRQLRRADHEELQLGHGGVRQRLIEGAVGHADGLAPVAVLALVPRVVSAEADLPRGERSLVDVDVLGPVVTGELQGGGCRAEVSADGRVGRARDLDPRPQAGVGSLPEVGVAGALAQAESVDLARCERR